MTEAKHTPGPWTAEPAKCADTTIGFYIEADSKTVACVYHENDVPLITAAPDLLAALKGALVIVESLPLPDDLSGVSEAAFINRREAIRAAIAKAEGRS